MQIKYYTKAPSVQRMARMADAAHPARQFVRFVAACGFEKWITVRTFSRKFVKFVLK